jgi:molecular chaperone HtpG
MEKKSMAAANEMVSNYIPDDITFSILSKLPLKSLKRFECVQKSWSHLFENHYFMNMFRNKFLSYKNDTSSLILRDVENREGVFYYFSGEKFENKVKLNWSNSFKQNGIRNTRVSGFDSVNGMLCLYNGRTGFVVLWNPTTRTIKHLPPSDAQVIEWAMICH